MEYHAATEKEWTSMICSKKVGTEDIMLHEISPHRMTNITYPSQYVRTKSCKGKKWLCVLFVLQMLLSVKFCFKCLSNKFIGIMEYYRFIDFIFLKFTICKWGWRYFYCIIVYSLCLFSCWTTVYLFLNCLFSRAFKTLTIMKI